MLRSLPPRIRRLAPRGLGALVAVLLLVAAVFVAAGVGGGGGSPAGSDILSGPAAAGPPIGRPPAEAPTMVPRREPTPPVPPSAVLDPTAQMGDRPAPGAEPGGPPTGRSHPVTLDIPAIDIAGAALSTLGLNPDETVEVPTDFQRAGWFGLGPTPGEAGAAVILGHVDSLSGPAVFFRLRSMAAGDLVEVGLADGRVAQFVVSSVETYPKDRFPAQRVYTSNGSSDLQLVTCGGEFDRSTGHYLSNVVVYTSLVDMVPA